MPHRIVEGPGAGPSSHFPETGAKCFPDCPSWTGTHWPSDYPSYIGDSFQAVSPLAFLQPDRLVLGLALQPEGTALSCGPPGHNQNSCQEARPRGASLLSVVETVLPSLTFPARQRRGLPPGHKKAQCPHNTEYNLRVCPFFLKGLIAA